MRLVFQTLAGAAAPKIVRAPLDRGWMGVNADPALRAANECWFVLNAAPFVARWDGGDGAEGLRIESEEVEGAGTRAGSRLGRGVLSLEIDCAVSLDEDYDLWLTGPLNRTKDGIQPLTSIASSSAPLVMHWRFTRRHAPVAFEIDEPICTLFPVRRGLMQDIEVVFENDGGPSET